MRPAYDRFQKLMDDINVSRNLYSHMERFIRPPYDFTDILRWEWIQSVSALDKLIHDLVRIGMIRIFEGNRPITPKYSNFQIGLETQGQMQANPITASHLLEQQIVLKHSFLAFQDPEKISDALSYIWLEQHKWQAIALRMGRDESGLRTEIKNIVIRRNQIAHEGDYSEILNSKQPITESDTEQVISLIRDLGESIYSLVK